MHGKKVTNFCIALSILRTPTARRRGLKRVNGFPWPLYQASLSYPPPPPPDNHFLIYNKRRQRNAPGMECIILWGHGPDILPGYEWAPHPICIHRVLEKSRSAWQRDPQRVMIKGVYAKWKGQTWRRDMIIRAKSIRKEYHKLQLWKYISNTWGLKKCDSYNTAFASAS
jgi:hypothetical protein